MAKFINWEESVLGLPPPRYILLLLLKYVRPRKPINRKIWTKTILSILSQHREELKEMGVEQIALLDSYARGTAVAGSDVDLLMTLKEPKYMLLLQVTDYLTELLGHKNDLVRKGPHLKRRFLDAVEKDLAAVGSSLPPAVHQSQAPSVK